MNPKLFVNLIVISSLLFSCKKEFPPTTINGHISEFYSNAPMGNIPLRICDVTINPQSPQLLQVGNIYDSLTYDLKIIADESGNFELTTNNLGEDKKYVMVFWDRKYITSEAYVIKSGETNKMDIKLRPVKTLKVTAKNTEQQNNYDEILLNIAISNNTYMYDNYLESIMVNENLLKKNSDTTIYMDVISDVSYKIQVIKLNHNIFVNRIESVQYIDNIDTTSVVVEY